MGIAVRRRRDGIESALEIAMRMMPAPPEDRGYPDDYVDFAHDVLGIELTDSQIEIFRSVKVNRRTAVRSCHGSGKTRGTAALAVSFLHVEPYSKVIVTGPTNDHVRDVMFQNIRFLYSNAKGDLMGKPSSMRWEITPDWYMIGLKPAEQNSGRMQGHHASRILLLCDEAAETPTAIIDQLESMMTGEGARTLLIGNPTLVGGPYYEAFHSQSSMWHQIKIEAKDTPNIKAGRIVIPAMIDQTYIDEQIKLHGEDSDWVQARVYAEFPKQQATAWVQLVWVSKAKQLTAGFNIHRLRDPLDFGIDVARTGTDECWLTCRQGPYVWFMERWKLSNLMSSAGLVQHHVADMRRRVAEALNLSGNQVIVRNVNVDETGIGAGLADRLQERKDEGRFDVQNVVGVNFGAGSSDPEKWENKRQEMWYGIRERFMEGRIIGNFDDIMIADLTGAMMKGGGSGYVSGRTMPHVEGKDEIKKRIKRSPDAADSVALAFYMDPSARVYDAAGLAPVGVRVENLPYYAMGEDDDID